MILEICLLAGFSSRKISRILEHKLKVMSSFNHFLQEFKDDYGQYDF